MIEALRGLGYSTATALADIIDNSISARARRIDVQFTWSGASRAVAVTDDGTGMDESELDAAMQLGGTSPLARRAEHDLGRFGLGLKTASFSQCRRLTVASRKDGRTTCLRWDLDVLAASDDHGWHLMEEPAAGSEALVAPIDAQEHGTIVLWERLDRVVTTGFGEQDLLDLIDSVEHHLAMVFHRFLSKTQPPFILTVNGRAVKPWDPFLTGHPATWSSPIVPLGTADNHVELQCHVLPHKDRLDARVHDSAAGVHGWTAQQGFYVYRNERLLLAGSWLGLGRGRSWTKEESHRLARIRLDISNAADSDWKIDIRKSTARPPVPLREVLTRLAEDTRERARRVFAHRGQGRGTAGGIVSQAWRVEHFKGGVRYRIDDGHPAIKAVLDDAGQLESLVRAMLRVIEETVPVQRIWLDTTESKETPRIGFAGESPAAISSVLAVVFRNMIHRKGLSPAQAREKLVCTEPFNNHPELVAALPD